MEHYRKLERIYIAAKINRNMYESTTVAISEGQAEIRLEISEKYFHALDAIHGSVYFKLQDDAAFFAVNSLVEDVFVLTAAFNINLTRPASKGMLKSIGKVRSKTKNVFIAESSLVDDNGKEIGFGTGTFMRSKVALTPEIGYK